MTNKRIKTMKPLNKDVGEETLSDYDLDKAVFVNEKWELEKSYPLNIRIQQGILAAAKFIAKEKGVPYQTLLKLYISDGIRRDKKMFASV